MGFPNKSNIRRKDCMGRAEVTLPRDSRRMLKARKSVLQIRYADYEIKRPQILNKNKALRDSVGVWGLFTRKRKALLRGKSR